MLPKARQLSKLDSTKVLPELAEVDEDARELTASEFTAALEGELSAAFPATPALPSPDRPLSALRDDDAAESA